jgi:hypothetical protein
MLLPSATQPVAAAARRLPLGILAALLLVTFAACGGDDSPSTPTPGPDVDAGGEDIPPPGPDTDAPDEDTAPPEEDADTDTPDTDTPDEDTGPVDPGCEPPLRQVDFFCAGPFDRICTTNAECRPAETCEDIDDQGYGTCILGLDPPLVCPGAAGCAPPAAGTPMRVGFASRVITPQGWEQARPAFLASPDRFGTLRAFTGDVKDTRTFCDCGRDLICPPALVESGCFSLPGVEYTGPDADGSEGDRLMQGAWLAGFGNNRPAGLCPEALLSPLCDDEFDCCQSLYAHDEIWARGFVMEHGETRIGVVVLDTVGYFYSEIERIEAALDPALGIDQVIVAATHSHEGPDTMGRWGPGFGGSGLPTDTGIVPQWMTEIRAAIAEVLAESVAELEAFDLYVGHDNHGDTELAARDSRDPFIFNDVVTTLQFVRPGEDPRTPGNTIGTVINYHSHVEALSGGNAYITSDYAHYLREAMENGLPAAYDDVNDINYPEWPALGGTSVFIAGTVGGLLTQLGVAVRSRDGRLWRDDTYGKAWAQGTRLAEVAHRTLGAVCETPGDRGCAVRVEDPSLVFASRELFLEIVNTQFQAAAITLGLFDRDVYNWREDQGSFDGPFPEVLTRVSQVRVGPITFQTMPGEAFSETMVGYRIEQDRDGVIFGNPADRNCAANRLDRLAEDAEGERFPCLVRANNPNPPDMLASPDSDDDYLRGFIPGAYMVLIGLGNDELGYLVPSYDFKTISNGLAEAEGDHYEETVSPGDELPDIMNAVREITSLLD